MVQHDVTFHIESMCCICVHISLTTRLKLTQIIACLFLNNIFLTKWINFQFMFFEISSIFLPKQRAQELFVTFWQFSLYHNIIWNFIFINKNNLFTTFVHVCLYSPLYRNGNKIFCTLDWVSCLLTLSWWIRLTSYHFFLNLFSYIL